jgi:hypothetical protein
LRAPGVEDARCVEPTSATRTNDVHSSAVRSRLSRTAFTARDAPQQSVAAALLIEGTSVFTTPEPLWPHFSCGPSNALSSCLRPRGFRSRAWACSTRGARWDETSDTSVANPSSSSRSRHLRAWSRVSRCALMVSDDTVEVGRVRSPPRPPLPPAREDRRLQMIRGAFHRQGPFVGSGGPYSPGPATAAPLLAMLRPLDDALTSPWAWFPISSRCGPTRFEMRIVVSLDALADV